MTTETQREPDISGSGDTARRRKRWPWITAGAFAAVGAGIALALPSGHAATMHGTVSVTTWAGDSTFCDSPSGKDPGPGAQVTVTAPSGDVIGDGELAGNPATSTATILGCVEGVTVYKFTVAGLPAEPRYGVRVSGLDGTIWFRPAALASAGITVGG
jgi:hypothetical protein